MTVAGAPPARFDMPALACDCHMHVFGPLGAYPYAAGRIYTPPEAAVEAYLEMRQRHGLARTVLVQPSVYGTDNRRHLDALAEIPGSRGVAVIAGDEPDSELARLDEAGFRGIRVNLKQGITREPIEATLARLGDRLGEIGWHLQIYATPEEIAAVEVPLAQSRVPVMLDHYAGLSPWAGPSQPGAEAVLRLMRGGNCWMKLSAPYNSPCDDRKQGGENSRRLVEALVEAAPDRLVWGSNWPHPGLTPRTTPTEAPIAPLQVVDDAAMLELFLDWVGGPALARQVLADNPARFYGF